MIEENKNGLEKVIHLSAEVYPFSKKGGLGDVVSILPNKMYENSKIDSIVISPFYKSIKVKLDYYERINLKFLDVETYYDVYLCNKNNIKYFFIKLENVYSMDETYMNDNRAYSEEVGLQYFIFGKCIADFISRLDVNKIAVITHDWHVAGVYPYLKKQSNIIKKIHIIHNYHYKGDFYYDIIDYVEARVKEEIEFQYSTFGYCNMSLFAMKNADKIVTVSNEYAKELINREAPHTGLDAIEAYKDKVVGILNGVDYSIWDPSKDMQIYKEYDYNTIEAKQYNKKCLYKELEINFSLNKPLVAYINRLTPQKGIDLFVDLKSGKAFDPVSRMNELVGDNIFLIICGDCPGGENSVINKKLAEISNNENINFMYINKYSEKVAHKILAAADIFLLPSRYEPCGLTQLYSLSYGAVPIVNNVGGLKETIRNVAEYNKDSNGFVMKKFNFTELIKAVNRATELYYRKSDWDSLVKRCMKFRFTWDESIKKYIDLLI